MREINSVKLDSPTLFLGGTVGKYDWRSTLISLLDSDSLAYFNPIVDNWDDSAREKEFLVKNSKNTVEVYVITSDMKGVFSIAEAVDASNKKPEQTIFLIVRDGFNTHQLKSLDATKDIISGNGGSIAHSLEEVASLYKRIELAYRAKRISVLARKAILSEFTI